MNSSEEFESGSAAEALRLSFTQDVSTRILDSSSTLSETLNFIIDGLRKRLNVDHADILFEYEDGLRIEYSSDPGEAGRRVPMDESISGLAMKSAWPIVENDLTQNHDLARYYLARREYELLDVGPSRSFAATRVMFDDQAVGAVNVESQQPGAFATASRVEMLKTAAAQVSLALSHAALFDEDALRAQTDELLVADTSSDNDVVVGRVLADVLRAMGSLVLINAEHVEVLYPDPDDPRILIVAYSTNPGAIGVRVVVGESVCGEAFRTRTTIVEQRALDRPEYKPLQEGMLCEMAIPLNLGGRERFSIGVLNIESPRENAFPRVAQVVAERFTRRVITLLALARLRSDFQNAVQDQFLVLAADQVLNTVHQLNNHIGAARVNAVELLRELETAEPSNVDLEGIRDGLRSIVGDTERGLGIPDDLRRRLVAPPESVDVNAQVREGVSRARLPRSVRVAMTLATDLPEVPCTALEFVVENLLLNSVAAMSETGGEIQVATSIDDRGDAERFVAVTVADCGRGMTDGEVDRLFEPRRQPHGRGRGLGFGMVWVKAWVRRANGLIDVDSAPGRGTLVTIRFQIDTLVDDIPNATSEETA